MTFTYLDKTYTLTEEDFVTLKHIWDICNQESFYYVAKLYIYKKLGIIKEYPQYIYAPYAPIKRERKTIYKI